MKKKRNIFAAVAGLLVLGIAWMIWGNVTVGLTRITLWEDNLPAAFDGLRIAHVSDLHNSSLWEKAISRLEKAKPDIICITGDLVDANTPDISVAFSFAEEAVKIAPCFYIIGNHEPGLEAYEALLQGLRDRGVTVLLDENVMLTKGDDQICLVGHRWKRIEDIGKLTNFDGYNLLLCHYPENFSYFVDAEYDLVLSGHAHGGQFRLPFIGGLYAPGQGTLPEYDAGLYTEGKTDMIVSRGIGNSTFPIRFNNRPEVILVQLRCK